MSYKISKYPVEKLDPNADIQPGFAFKSERFTDNPDDIPLVKGENVHQGYVDWQGAKHWPADEYDSLSKYHLVPGDVVLAMDRPWVTAGLKWSYIKPHDPNALLVQRVARIRAKNKLDQDYLRHVISSSYFANYLQPIVTGVNVPHISGKQIGAFRIPIPDLKIQRKIAAILTAYDDLIEVNKRRIALLENMAEEIYREWFVRLRFPGHQHTRFVKGVPEGWEVRRISEVYKTSSGGTPSRKVPEYYNGDIQWIKTGELKNLFTSESEERISASGVENSSAKVFPAGTVIMAMYCAMPDISISSTDAATNQACCAFLPKLNWLHYGFTYYLLSGAQKQLIMFAHGAAQQNLSQDIIGKFQILLPCKHVVEQFGRSVEPILGLVKELSKVNSSLTKTRDLLLPRLISGKLSVEELDIQFPPSMQDQPLAPASADEARHA